MDEKTIEFNKSEFIKKLEQLRELEIQKAVKDIDTDFIDTIVLLGLELKGLKTELTPEEVEEKVRKIPFVEKTTTLNTPPTSVKGRATKVKSHKILLIAAIISILVAIFTISSIAFDWNIFDELKNRFGTVANVPVNEEIDANGVTVVSNGEFFVFATLEDALKSQNINMLYPQQLPNNITLNKLMIHFRNDKNKITLVFNNKDLLFSVTLKQELSSDIKYTANEVVEIKGIKCYLIEMNDIGVIQVYFEYKGNIYLISYNNKQDLIGIIENLKELQ